MDSFDITLTLLRSSLWGTESPDLNLGDGWWEEIFEISKSQGVHTLLPDSFRKGCVPPKHTLARWLVEVEHAEKAYSRVEAVGEELSEKWAAAGIRSAILKGTSVASMYPRPNHRLSGDIDFYFPDADGFSRANRIARQLSDLGTDSDGDTHYLFKGVVVEHHSGWSHLSSHSAYKLDARLDGNRLIPEDTLLMLSSHILRHSLVGGAGLRQLADLAVATRFFNGKYDKTAFAERLKSLGLMKWAGLLSAVMYGSFGVPKEELPVVPDTEFYRRFIGLVRFDGDLGKEGRGLFAGFFRRILLFLRIAPKECFARYFFLSVGRMRNKLVFGRK